MKKLLFFLLSLLCILPACDNCDEDIPERPFVREGSASSHSLFLTFEDEKRQDLTRDFVLTPIKDGTVYSVAPEDMKVRFFMNGVEDNRQMAVMVTKGEYNHNIFGIYATSTVGFYENDTFGLSEDIYYPFMYKIVCPTVFGDSEEHIITVVQRSIDTGTQNMCSVTLDDEVLDINIKNGLEPYVITITRTVGEE